MRDPLNKTITTIQPSGIRKFFDVVHEMKDAISLGVGEPDFDTPWHIRDEGIYSLEKGKTHYTSNAGLKELKTEIDRYLAEVPGEISAFVFNLGFMPGRDKTIMTTEDTSLPAIKKAINLVKTGGIVSVMAYSGHKEGEAECAAIYEFLKTLPSKKYHVAYVHMINQKKTAPSLFLVTPKVEGRKPL